MAFGLGFTLYLKPLSYISAFIQKKNAIPVPSGCRLSQRVTAEEQRRDDVGTISLKRFVV